MDSNGCHHEIPMKSIEITMKSFEILDPKIILAHFAVRESTTGGPEDGMMVTQIVGQHLR